MFLQSDFRVKEVQSILTGKSKNRRGENQTIQGKIDQAMCFTSNENNGLPRDLHGRY